MGGWINQYHCAYDIYLPQCIYLEFFIIIDRVFSETDHRKDFVDGINAKYKRMPKLEMENTELFCDNPNV